MPVIRINEIDNSSILNSASDNVVYVPGKMGTGATSQADMDTPTLCESISDFTKKFGTAPASTTVGEVTTKDASWIFAFNLIRAGLVVLYEAVSDATTPKVETDDFWNRLEDKAQYNIRFLTCISHDGKTGNIGMSDSSVRDTIAKKMEKCARTRGDCIALLDHDLYATGTTHWTASGLRALFADDSSTTPATKNPLQSTYASMFTPWCSCAGIKQEFNGVDSTVILPGSFVFLSAFAKSVKSNATWFAAAGSFRGIPFFEAEPVIKWSTAEINTLQGRVITDGDFGANDNKSFAINTINEVKPFGNIVWGNRTLFRNADGLVASSLLNIRQLCCDIKKVTYRAARKYTFEQNSDVLWVNFKSEITPTLDKMLSGQGINGYKIIKVTTGIKGRLTATIRISPIEAVEDFDITIELTDSVEE